MYLKLTKKMTASHRISVILATYNEDPENLNNALKSIFDQSLEPYELIIVIEPDEKNIDLIKSFKSSFKIKLIFNRKRNGLTSSLNIACRAANGDFIARMDSDDFWHKDKLEKQISHLLDNNYDVIGCDINLIDNKNTIIGERIYSARGVKSNFLFQNGLCHPSVLMKTHLLKSYGFYNTYYKSAEDLELWLRFLANGVKIGYYPEKLMEYRIRENKIRSKTNWKFNVMARVKHNFRVFNPISAFISIAIPFGVLIIVALNIELLAQKIYNNFVIRKN